MDLESQWEQFMSGDFNVQEMDSYNHQLNHDFDNSSDEDAVPVDAPRCGDLNISTKTKIIYLSSTFILNELFWKMKTIDYDSEEEGIIKKQIKFNFTNSKDVEYFEKMIKYEKNAKVKILNQINNPNGRVTFKDVRKVDIGYCKNDIVNPKKESKSAFYNCFVIIFRKRIENRFQEYHVKLFNSGKVEIPGIQSNEMLENVVDILLKYINMHYDNNIHEVKEKRQLILVNSNFNCNYYLNRESLVHILKKKYKIKCGMDSCSYPGIQCKHPLKNGGEISFMIFRTGSVLIVGKCEDDELYSIYNFLKDMFKDEYKNILEQESELEKEEKKKIGKKKTKGKKTISIYI